MPERHLASTDSILEATRACMLITAFVKNSYNNYIAPYSKTKHTHDLTEEQLYEGNF